MLDARELKQSGADLDLALDSEVEDYPSAGGYGNNITGNDAHRGRPNGRGSVEARQGKRQRRGSAMDIDVPDDNSAASSSIPSSRRSSFRGSRGSRRGSVLSVTVPESRLASPRVDASTASGVHPSSGPLQSRSPLISGSDPTPTDLLMTAPFNPARSRTKSPSRCGAPLEVIHWRHLRPRAQPAEKSITRATPSKPYG